MHTEITAVRIISTSSRILLVFVAYAALLVATSGLVATTNLVAAPPSPPPGPEPLMGLPIMALASAGLMTWLVLRSRWRGARLALAIGAVCFGANTLLPWLRAFASPGQPWRTADGVAASWFGGAVFSATFAAAAVVLLGQAGQTRAVVSHGVPSVPSIFTDTVKVLAAAVSYAIVHRNFEFHSPASGLVQGSVWALVGLLVVRLLRGGAAEASLALGLLFALAAPVHQLLPYPVVSGEATAAHRLTVAFAQFFGGAVLGIWFSWRGPHLLAPRRDRHVRAGSDPRATPARRKGRDLSIRSKGVP